MTEASKAGPRGLAVIGFGEAGQSIVSGLREANPDLPIHLHDILFAAREGDAMRATAAGLQAVCHDSHGAAVAEAEIVLSTVVAKSAVEAARSAAAQMTPDKFYVDLNSAAPRTKQQVAEVLSGSGCSVLDGAILSPVPPHRHRVPILLSGPSAGGVTALLNALGCNVEEGSETIGAAAATKMLRSIMIKGIEALLLECTAAASHFGATDRILNSLEQSLPGKDWPERARYLISRTALHGERRAVEMTEVATMLRDIGMDPLMAEAASKRISWGVSQGLAGDLVDERFPTVEALEEAFARRKDSSKG